MRHRGPSLPFSPLEEFHSTLNACFQSLPYCLLNDDSAAVAGCPSITRATSVVFFLTLQLALVSFFFFH